MDVDPQKFHIRELRDGDRVNGLSLGKPEHAPLKAFLKKAALEFHLNNIVKTYVLVDMEIPPRVYGYVSLMCSELTLDSVQRPLQSKNAKCYDTFPAIKLARLAIDKSLQGRGYGSVLMSTAITIAKDFIMSHVGCRFLTVDSKPDAIAFYEKAGFIFLEAEDNKKNPNPLMLLDLHQIK